MTQPIIQIDKGIPLPSPMYGQNRAVSPFGRMEVGDSFVYPPSPSGLRMTRNRAASSAFQYGKRNNKTFTQRLVVEDGEQVVRIWRTS